MVQNIIKVGAGKVETLRRRTEEERRGLEMRKPP
jgi:hypothetical protein